MNETFSPKSASRSKRGPLATPQVFAAAGYTLFPLAGSSKIPRDAGWRSRDYSSFDAEAWLQQGGNVGIRLAADDLVIDVDPRHDGDTSLNVLSFDIDADLDRAPTNITGRGDGGRHLFFKKPADAAIVTKHPRLPGLDFKTEGGFVVAPGSTHPDTSGLYEVDSLEWTGIENVALAPQALVDLLRRPEATERTGEGGELTCEELELALSGVRSEDYGQGGKHHDQWITIAAAAHDATDGLGLEEWLTWCEQDEQYGPDARELNTRRWNSFTAGKPGGVTYKTLLKALSDAGRHDILSGLRTSAADDFEDDVEEGAPTPASVRKVAGLTYLRADEVEQQNITWLWPNRIAIGKLSGIAGPPDQGKSQLTAAISAAVTTGRKWPDVGAAPAGAVAMLSAEDDASDTIAPRLEAAGADMSKVYLVNMLVRRDKGQSMFNLAEDISQLTALKNAHSDINLVIIDPISAYMGSSKSVDTFRNSDVRGVLAPLGEWAAKHGVAVVFVTHFSKSGTGSAINRVMDSLAFTALARSFWVVVPEVDERTGETGRKLLLKGKQNIAQPMGGLAYRIEGVTLDNGVQTSRIVWDEEVDLTGDDVLLREHTSSSPRLDAAKAFLVGLLKNGEMNTRDIEAAAKVGRHAWATVRRAKDELPISVYQHGDGWSWELEGTETE